MRKCTERDLCKLSLLLREQKYIRIGQANHPGMIDLSNVQDSRGTEQLLLGM